MESQTVTRDDLVVLLRAKDEAEAAYLAHRLSDTKGLPVEQRVESDLHERAAWTAKYRAEEAYNAALKAYLAAQQQVAA